MDSDHVTISEPLNRTSEIYVQVLGFIKLQVERPKDRTAAIAEGQDRIEKKIDELPIDIAERVVAFLGRRELAKATEAGLERRTIV